MIARDTPPWRRRVVHLFGVVRGRIFFISIITAEILFTCKADTTNWSPLPGGLLIKEVAGGREIASFRVRRPSRIIAELNEGKTKSIRAEIYRTPYSPEPICADSRKVLSELLCNRTRDSLRLSPFQDWFSSPQF